MLRSALQGSGLPVPLAATKETEMKVAESVLGENHAVDELRRSTLHTESKQTSLIANGHARRSG